MPYKNPEKERKARRAAVVRWQRRNPERRAFYQARQRCTNRNNISWKNYGARGIEFRFKSFEEFWAELGPRPKGKSLDRIFNAGHYEPGNVRWATPKQQRHNRRN